MCVQVIVGGESLLNQSLVPIQLSHATLRRKKIHTAPRAGNRRFGWLRALRLHVQNRYTKPIRLWETLRRLNRPGLARTRYHEHHPQCECDWKPKDVEEKLEREWPVALEATLACGSRQR